MQVASPAGSIEALEQRLFSVSDALKNGDVETLVSCIAEFHALVVLLARELAFSRDGAQPSNNAETLRMKELGATLVQVREQLVRRQGLVEQALRTVIPATQTSVYAKQSGPYGAGARSSGRFKSFSA